MGQDRNDERVPSLSHHILPTSSNMLGICFAIFSFTRASGDHRTTLLDECLIIPIILFLVAAFISYLSMRSPSKRKERIADGIFVLGLITIAFIAIGLIFEFIT